MFRGEKSMDIRGRGSFRNDAKSARANDEVYLSDRQSGIYSFDFAFGALIVKRRKSNSAMKDAVINAPTTEK